MSDNFSSTSDVRQKQTMSSNVPEITNEPTESHTSLENHEANTDLQITTACSCSFDQSDVEVNESCRELENDAKVAENYRAGLVYDAEKTDEEILRQGIQSNLDIVDQKLKECRQQEEEQEREEREFLEMTRKMREAICRKQEELNAKIDNDVNRLMMEINEVKERKQKELESIRSEMENKSALLKTYISLAECYASSDDLPDHPDVAEAVMDVKSNMEQLCSELRDVCETAASLPITELIFIPSGIENVENIVGEITIVPPPASHEDPGGSMQ